jgi:hypothetical protein
LTHQRSEGRSGKQYQIIERRLTAYLRYSLAYTGRLNLTSLYYYWKASRFTHRQNPQMEPSKDGISIESERAVPPRKVEGERFMRAGNVASKSGHRYLILFRYRSVDIEAVSGSYRTAPHPGPRTRRQAAIEWFPLMDPHWKSHAMTAPHVTFFRTQTYLIAWESFA